jgi:hypothetical protein
VASFSAERGSASLPLGRSDRGPHRAALRGSPMVAGSAQDAHGTIVEPAKPSDVPPAPLREQPNPLLATLRPSERQNDSSRSESALWQTRCCSVPERREVVAALMELREKPNAHIKSKRFKLVSPAASQYCFCVAISRPVGLRASAGSIWKFRLGFFGFGMIMTMPQFKDSKRSGFGCDTIYTSH